MYVSVLPHVLRLSTREVRPAARKLSIICNLPFLLILKLFFMLSFFKTKFYLYCTALYSQATWLIWCCGVYPYQLISWTYACVVKWSESFYPMHVSVFYECFSTLNRNGALGMSVHVPSTPRCPSASVDWHCWGGPWRHPQVRGMGRTPLYTQTTPHRCAVPWGHMHSLFFPCGRFWTRWCFCSFWMIWIWWSWNWNGEFANTRLLVSY